MNVLNNSKQISVICPTLITHGETVTANIDVQGQGDYAVVNVLLSPLGATGGTGPTISILQSDDTVVTNFATITADRTAENPGTNANGKIVSYYVNLDGKKRYLRASITSPTSNTNSNVTVAVNASLHDVPIGASGAGSLVHNTNDAAVIVG